MSKNRFGKFWNFDPWRLQFWPEPKNDWNDFEMFFRELSNAAFCFSLRRPGAEIMGGRSNAPPPPPAGGGKSRGPAGRGLADIDMKLGTILPTIILVVWCQKFRLKKRYSWFCDVTSRDFGAKKMFKNSSKIRLWSELQENCTQNCTWTVLREDYLGFFFNFEFLSLKLKKKLVLEKCLVLAIKSKILRIFKKRNMLKS